MFKFLKKEPMRQLDLGYKELARQLNDSSLRLALCSHELIKEIRAMANENTAKYAHERIAELEALIETNELILKEVKNRLDNQL